MPINVWTETIRLADVFHDEDRSYVQRRDAIVQRLRGSRWIRNTDRYTLTDLVDELADAPDTDTFDYVWDLIYDYADVDRVWIETIR